MPEQSARNWKVDLDSKLEEILNCAAKIRFHCAAIGISIREVSKSKDTECCNDQINHHVSSIGGFQADLEDLVYAGLEIAKEYEAQKLREIDSNPSGLANKGTL